MKTLAQIQGDFQHYLLQPGPDPAVQADMVSDAKADAASRLQIYADAYRLRLLEALQEDFEVLHVLLGDEAFETLCLDYIQAHPSRYRSLRHLGQYMASFLKQDPSYGEHPVLSELAAFEWALMAAFDARDDTVLLPETLAALPPEAWPALRLRLADSVCQLSLHSNAPQVHAAIKAETAPPALRFDPDAQAWLIWRQQLSPYFRPLSVEESWALQQLSQGSDFTALCAGLCRWLPETQVAAQAAHWLQQWMRDGLIGHMETIHPDGGLRVQR